MALGGVRGFAPAPGEDAAPAARELLHPDRPGSTYDGAKWVFTPTRDRTGQNGNASGVSTTQITPHSTFKGPPNRV